MSDFADVSPAAEWDGRDIASLMSLEALGSDNFTNPVSVMRDDRHLYGGQVLAHAVGAAMGTVEDRTIHSLHAYFLRRGDGCSRVVFNVERTRDGGSFSSRRVVASQGGAPIFHMNCSFKTSDCDDFDHQAPNPEGAPNPDTLVTLEEYLETTGDHMAAMLLERRAPFSHIDIRIVDPQYLGGARPDARRQVWFRIPSARSCNQPHIHTQLLAYLSDYWLAGAALAPHDFIDNKRRPLMASIDHALWFHRPARVDQWLLYDMDSPSARNAVGLSRGLIFTTDGSLAASSAQEAMLRTSR